MKEESKENALKKPQSQTISREDARSRVRKWLDVIGSLPLFKKDPDSIPRAIYIPLKDLKQLLEAYPEDDVKGVRVYFGLDVLPGEPVTPSALSGLMVPVLFKGDKHHDHIIEETENPNETSIYDFTTPCPVYCDKQSELYVAYP